MQSSIVCVCAPSLWKSESTQAFVEGGIFSPARDSFQGLPGLLFSKSSRYSLWLSRTFRRTAKLLASDAMSDSSDCTACGSSKSPVAEADTESSKVSPPTELDLARCGSGGARNDELGLPSLMKSSESSLALEPATPEAPLGSTLVTGALWLDPSSTSSPSSPSSSSISSRLASHFFSASGFGPPKLTPPKPTPARPTPGEAPTFTIPSGGGFFNWA